MPTLQHNQLLNVFILSTLLFTVTLTHSASAATLLVDPDNGINIIVLPITQQVIFDNDCSTIPCKTIEFAISKANNGDTLSLADETYHEHGLRIDKNLNIDAGPGWAIIDAGFQGRHFVIDPNTQVEMNTIKFLNGIEVQGGSIKNEGTLVMYNCQFINNIASFGAGGAIHNSGVLGVHNSTLLDNQASSDGGAIYNSRTTSISNTQIVSNDANNSGGGISNYRTLFILDSTMALNNANNGGAIDNSSEGAFVSVLSSVLNDNTANFLGGAIVSRYDAIADVDDSYIHNNNADLGGAIYIDDSDLTLSNSYVYDNTASNDGGGLHNVRGTATVEKSTFDNNIASNGNGGAIVSGNSASNTISDSTFFKNTAISGGGIYLFLTTTTIRSSTFHNNTADDGAALYNVESIIDMVNSTISNNTANNNGGGIYDANFLGAISSLDVTNSTFYGNSAGGMGGAIYSEPVVTPLTLANSIITLTGSGGDCINTGVAFTGGNNLVDDLIGDCGGISIGAITAASIDSLNWNGGPTQTHALLPGGNAVDAGARNCPDPITGFALTQDQRGDPRPAGVACDIGAYELN